MVEIADINDRESLQVWLEETDQPREACVALAHRAAMRVMAKTAGWYQQFNHSPLPVFRALLVTGVSARTLASGGTSRRTLSDLRRAAGSAARAAAYSIAADPVFAPNYIAADAAIASSGEAYRYGDEKDIDWLAVQSDCIELLAGNLLIELPIQNSSSNSDLDFSVSERSMSAGYEFWIDWYERALAGEPQPWRLLSEIALQEDAFWQGTDDEVMARINKIVEDYEGRLLDQIRERIADQSETNLGFEAELAARKRVLEQIEVLLESLPSASSEAGIGHNQPPDEFALDDEQIAELSANTAELKRELEKPVPDLEVALEKTSWLRRTIGWAAGKADLTISEFCKKFGATLGVAFAADASGLLEISYWTEIVSLFESAKIWFSVTLGI